MKSFKKVEHQIARRSFKKLPKNPRQQFERKARSNLLQQNTRNPVKCIAI